MRGAWLYIPRLTNYSFINPKDEADTHSKVVTLDSKSPDRIASRRDLSANRAYVGWAVQRTAAQMTPLLIHRIQSPAAKCCCYFRRTGCLRIVCASVIANDLIELGLPVVLCPAQKTKRAGHTNTVAMPYRTSVHMTWRSRSRPSLLSVHRVLSANRP